MIVLTNVTKKISSDFKLIVNNLKLCDGVNYVVSGKNGNGKSLFLKMLLGIICRDTGHIKIDKDSFSGFLGIERMLDFVTPKEYFFIVCKSYGLKRKEVLIRYNNLNSFFNRKYMDEKKKICDYSDGNKQLIGIIAACLPYSNFIILDEPFNYLDEETAKSCVAMMNHLNKEKMISFIYSDNSNKYKLEKIETILIENGIVN